jgi:hypothetical protein
VPPEGNVLFQGPSKFSRARVGRRLKTALDQEVLIGPFVLEQFDLLARSALLRASTYDMTQCSLV